MNIKSIRKETTFAGKKLVIETGELAKLSTMSALVTYGETVVLATVVAGGVNPDLDFFPLTVSYEEKLYASGIIKNSRFMKRDGRPTDDAVVIRRLIDHAIRPLFPSDFANEVQVVATVLSLDEEADAEFTAMTAVAAALHASQIPWNGPMVTAKVGYINNDYVLNPTEKQQTEESELEMVVSFCGADKRFLAIETAAENLPENVVLGAIEHARNNIDPLLNTIVEFATEANPDGTKMEYDHQTVDEDLLTKANEMAATKIQEVYENPNNTDVRRNVYDEILSDMYTKFEGVYKKTKIEKAFTTVRKKVIRKMIVEKGIRPDGRGLEEVRSIWGRVDVLPRTHGSAIFSRGETQVLTVTTLGNPSAELLIQDMYGERSKRYIHYYNFPPFATGETGRMGAPGGREIGHGMLAEKALIPVIPTQDQFPYMILLMSEVLESNGSSSMASVCGSTMSLMQAGVPIKDMVAGVAMGIVVDEENDKYILLTDAMGLEDWTGHMDFKIAGTKDGITAIQLDMKVNGLPMELLPRIFERSKTARLHILDKMKEVISEPNAQLSAHAPKMVTIKVKPDQIGMIIGSGGKTIKEIQLKTGAEIGIDEDGTVFISADDPKAADKALSIIDGMTKEVNAGDIYEGTVKELADFGAFVEILPGRTGLLHVSEVAYGFVKDVADYLNVGDKVTVKVLDASRDGRISLSKKALEQPPEGMEEQDRPRRFDRNDRGGRDRNGHRGGRDRDRHRR